MGLDVLGVIPARLGSTRFPRKVLHPYRNRPLLYYVWRDVSKVKAIDRLVIATDSREIKNAAEGFGAEVFTTSRRHQTGSDRAAEVVEKLGGKIVINVQGDNFGLSPAVIERVIRSMRADRSFKVATLAFRIESDRELRDPSLVKVTVTGQGDALCFSRYPIPYLQKVTKGKLASQFPYLGHIGVYFYRKAALESFARHARTPLEQAESLEQLRILEMGERIRVYKTSIKSVSVDRPRDVKNLDTIYK